jgi:hypothetical protein
MAGITQRALGSFGHVLAATEIYALRRLYGTSSSATQTSHELTCSACRGSWCSTTSVASFAERLFSPISLLTDLSQTRQADAILVAKNRMLALKNDQYEMSAVRNDPLTQNYYSWSWAAPPATA